MMRDAIKIWFGEEDHRITPITIGLLNQTFIVDNSHGRFVLQKLNPIFAPEVNLDIDALTSHIEHKGIVTPRLVTTKKGDLWGLLDGHCWRLMTYISGDNYNMLPSSKHAVEAGRLVGNFHAALADFQHSYRFARSNVHDTKGHLEKLEKAIKCHAHHDLADQVATLGDRILSESRSLSDLSTLPLRHSHGDLKINNLLFGSTPDRHCLVDLDTIGFMPWPIEMADAFRSWCNLKGEDAGEVVFDEMIFAAALGSYAKVVRDFWGRGEVQLLIEAIRTIPLELSSRFLRDVLEDCYFGYDPKRFESRSAHNLIRAKGQFGVYCDIERKKAQLEQIIRRAFA